MNGWNNVTKSNGGVTSGFTSVFMKPKYTWNLNYYVGPENTNTTNGLRNLFDTTLLLTPTESSMPISTTTTAERDGIANPLLPHHW